MKRHLLAPALCALTLTACQPGPLNSPGTVANGMVLDEQIGTGAEAAYTAVSRLGAALAGAGLIDKAKFKAADQKAYDALQVVRTAYRAGNAGDYLAASTQVYAAVDQIKSLVK